MRQPVVFLLVPLLLASLVQANNLVQELQQLGQFNTFLEIAEKVGLLKTLSSAGLSNYTVFAPTDAAFTNRAKEVKSAGGEETLDDLKKVVRYHVVPGLAFSFNFKDDNLLTSLSGTPLRMNLYYQKTFTTFEQDGHFTGNLEQSVVDVQSLNGQPLIVNVFNKIFTINGAKVKKPDIETSNGLIHIMESTIDPIPSQNLADLISADPRLSTFLSLLTAAELTDLLSQPGPYTVFAPTNEAFGDIPKDKMEALLASPNLIKIVGQHIIPGATWFKEGMLLGARDNTLASKERQDMLVMQEDATGGIQVGSTAANATIIQSDIQATNGVLHIIDTVL